MRSTCLACSATQSLSMNRVEDSATPWDFPFEDKPFFFFSSLPVSMIKQAGSPPSLFGVGTRSNTNPRSRLELSFPITKPTCIFTILKPMNSRITAQQCILIIRDGCTWARFKDWERRSSSIWSWVSSPITAFTMFDRRPSSGCSSLPNCRADRLQLLIRGGTFSISGSEPTELIPNSSSTHSFLYFGLKPLII